MRPAVGAVVAPERAVAQRPAAPRGGWWPCSPPSASARSCAHRRQPSGTVVPVARRSRMRCATSRRTSSALTGSTPGTSRRGCRRRPAAPTVAVRRARRSRNRVAPWPARPRRFGVRRPMCTGFTAGGSRPRRSRRSASRIRGLRRIVGQRQPLGGEVVVDLAVRGGVPQPVVPDRRRLLARLVVAQQVADLVDQHRGVLFHGVRRHPGLVVVETPVASRRPCCRSDRSGPGRG